MEKRSLDNINLVCSKITYKDWKIHIEETLEGFTLQWVFEEVDLTNPEDTTLYPQKCREFFLHKNCTDSQIIRTCWIALKQAIEHETAEQFLVNGVRIFDPHTNYLELAKYMSTAITDDLT